jgi:uncharacterized protein (TIGR02147 family)
MVDIFEYTDYRSYLRAQYDYLKRARRGFSFRQFSRTAGFSSPNFLKLVIDGKRNLSDDSIERFARALKLGKEEARFFRTLVHLRQARTVEEKARHAEELIRSRPFRALNPLKPAQFAYYSSWWLVAIRELIDTAGFVEDPEWIGRQLVPPVSEGEARRALSVLESLELVARDEQGRLRQKSGTLSTEDEVVDASVGKFHKEMLVRASEAIDRFRQDERDRGQSAVYQAGFQLFPLSLRQKKGDRP